MAHDGSSDDTATAMMPVRKVSLDNLKEMRIEDGDTSSDSELDTGMERGGKKYQPDVLSNGWGHYLQHSFSELFLSSNISILLLCTPLTVLSANMGWGSGTTFCLAIVSLVPWGDRISFVTEDFVKYTNETAGGLFLASVGNLTEIIFCINCLRGGLLRVVQVSMLGSVLSNLLLVLGCAFLVGGARWDEQSFNKVAAVTNSGLLVIAVLALSLPSILDATHTGNGNPVENATLHVNVSLPELNGQNSWLSGHGSLENETLAGGDAPLWLSRFIACVLVMLYAMLIYFQFVTHTHLFEDEGDDDAPGILGRIGGAVWMAFITYNIWILSDYVVASVEDAADDLKMPVLFLSGIVVPIVGNAVEHASAVCFAMHNKMEISLGVAVGSAVQISIFVIPLNVIAGWFMDKPMTLNFHIFETVVLLLTTMGVAFMVSDGKSHWLKGAMLVASYFLIAAAFWAHSEPTSMT